MPGRFLETNFPATKVFVGQDSAENFPATAAFARRGSLVLRGSSESAEGGAEDVLFPKMNAVLQRSRAPSPFSTWVFERERERDWVDEAPILERTMESARTRRAGTTEPRTRRVPERGSRRARTPERNAKGVHAPLRKRSIEKRRAVPKPKTARRSARRQDFGESARVSVFGERVRL